MSYTNYLIEENNRTFVKRVRGFIPKNSIGIVPDSINKADYAYLKYVEVDGNVQIFVDEDLKAAGDAEKLQEERNFKLRVLRAKRDQAIKKADNEIKKHEDSDPNAIATDSEWRAYRNTLRALTDDYKYVTDSSKGKAALDAFALDMSDFTMPEKPS